MRQQLITIGSYTEATFTLIKSIADIHAAEADT